MLHSIIDKKATLTVIGIDPGSTFTGVAIAIVLYPSFTIVDLTVFTIDAGAIELKSNSFNFATNRLLHIREKLISLFTLYTPTDIVVESPFFNRLRPIAYGVLRETFFVIKDAIRSYDPFVSFNAYPPSNIKIGVGANYKDKKEQVTEAVLKHERLSNYVELLKISNEHEIDAVAAVITRITHLEKDGILLCL